MFSISTSTSIPRNTPKTLSSSALSLTDSGMHFRLVTTKNSTNFTLTRYCEVRLHFRKFSVPAHFIYKQLGSGLSPQSCLYFQDMELKVA